MSGGAGASMPIERRGFLSLDGDLALESVDIAVRRNQPVTYIGLDGAHPDVASHVRRKPLGAGAALLLRADGELPSTDSRAGGAATRTTGSHRSLGRAMGASIRSGCSRR
ncbi:hypothetical protein SMICM304S_05840 [Streptomyces microflavus]